MNAWQALIRGSLVLILTSILGATSEAAVAQDSSAGTDGRAERVEDKRPQRGGQMRLVTREDRSPSTSKGIVLPPCSEPPCEPVCGDGRCDADEECSCRLDCPPCNPSPASCGDGLCQPGETATSCPEDCHQVCEPSCAPGACGTDGCGGLCPCPLGQVCSGGVCATCTSECGSTVECGRDRCGNQCGTCPSGFACMAGDCVLAALCGDTICNTVRGESCSSCPFDCGACCGNGVINFPERCDGSQGCAANQTCVSCSFCEDLDPVVCGDGNCTDAERSGRSCCSSDCGVACSGRTCDLDGDGFVTEQECKDPLQCGGRVVGFYCILP